MPIGARRRGGRHDRTRHRPAPPRPGGSKWGGACRPRRAGMVGPFVSSIHMGPIDLAPDIRARSDVRRIRTSGCRRSPYLFDGEDHASRRLGRSNRFGGEVNWMTAGRASRIRALRARRAGKAGRVHGIQAWSRCRASSRRSSRAFAHHDAADLPSFEATACGSRLIAGRRVRRPREGRDALADVLCALGSRSRRAGPAGDRIPRARGLRRRRGGRGPGQRFAAGTMLVFGPGEPCCSARRSRPP